MNVRLKDRDIVFCSALINQYMIFNLNDYILVILGGINDIFLNENINGFLVGVKEKTIFSHLFLNQDILHTRLRLCMFVENIRMESIVSQILYLGLSCFFMRSRKIICRYLRYGRFIDPGTHHRSPSLNV